MQRLHSFEICYRLHGRHHRFVQKDSLMSDADAVYYASLHSGVGLANGLSFERGTASAMKQQALAIGLDHVSWSPIAL